MRDTNFRNFKNFCKKKGITVINEKKGWFEFSKNGVRVLICGKTLDFPEKFNFKVLGESEETFNKWSQAYYIADISNFLNSECIWCDIITLNSPYHIDRANNFKTWNKC